MLIITDQIYTILNSTNNVTTYIELSPTRALVPSDLTIKGTLQSPVTNLLGTSLANYL